MSIAVIKSTVTSSRLGEERVNFILHMQSPNPSFMEVRAGAQAGH